MSDLLGALPKQKYKLEPSQPTTSTTPPGARRFHRRDPIIPALEDGGSSSDSSASSASTADSSSTLRPDSENHGSSASTPHNPWYDYFEQELWLETEFESPDNRPCCGSEEEKQRRKMEVLPWRAVYHVYLTPPKDPKKGPLFICHHGAGVSGMSFALFAKAVRKIMPAAGVVSLEAREHGSVVEQVPRASTDADNGEMKEANEKEPSVANDNAEGAPRKSRLSARLSARPAPDFSIKTLVADTLLMIRLLQERMNWTVLPPSVFVGHSLGGAIATHVAADGNLGAQLIGFAVLDVVEGSAVGALTHMRSILRMRPRSFSSVESAIDWHVVRSRTLRNLEAAKVSVPSLLIKTEDMPHALFKMDDGRWTWRTELERTEGAWNEWFKGMSERFLRGKAAKSLILAGTDRLDRELMVGQMQGEFWTKLIAFMSMRYVWIWTKR